MRNVTVLPGWDRKDFLPARPSLNTESTRMSAIFAGPPRWPSLCASSQLFEPNLCDRWTHNRCADRCSSSGWLVTVPEFTPALTSEHNSSVVPMAAAARVHQLGRMLGCWWRWGVAIPATFGQWAPEAQCRAPRAEVLVVSLPPPSIVRVDFFLCPVVW